MTSGRFPPRLLAKVQAHELLHRGQVRRVDADLDQLLRAALDQGWYDVEALAWYGRFIFQEGSRGNAGHIIEAMLKAADRAEDAALVATGLAARAWLPDRSAGLRPDSSADADIARAVALLDELGGDPANAPTAYLSCGQAYQQRSLWELALDMYERAASLLKAPLPAPQDQIAATTQRTLLLRQLDGRIPLAAHYIELGGREVAAELAARRPRQTAEQYADLPRDLRSEVQAVDSLLAAIAREPEPVPPFQLLDSLHPTERGTFRSYVMLGQAIRAWDVGDLPRAAARAEIALLHLQAQPSSDVMPLVLRLSALADRPSRGWQRYAEDSVRRRDEARNVVLDAARAQLDAERVMLENERLSHRAYVDELTGLANRHAYSRQLLRLRKARPEDAVGVLMVDVDHFKRVNDTFGHGVGDSVLRVIGSLLLQMTRASDIAVRMGGDEFLVLLLSRNGVDVTSRGGELVDAVNQHPWHEVADGLTVGVSVGVTSGPAREVDRLISAADRSLYEAKTSGRARIGAVNR